MPTQDNPIVPPEMPFCHTAKLNSKGEIVDETYTVRAANWDRFQSNDTLMGKVIAQRQLDVRKLQPADLSRINSNGNGKHEPEAPLDEDPDPECPIHQVPLTRHEKDGEVWFSHKAKGKRGDYWCRGGEKR